ncbi:prefoldin subunit alpha [Candidatus Micrarchaeota archaeon]|nr:prefoldin subunit alpha [Candidatus Micrarchaeota archaeon]
MNDKMATPQEMHTQLSYELAVYKEQISLIKRETERIGLTTVDLTNALSTVENLKKEEEKKTLLVPVGGGTMVKGAVSDTRILVPVGAQYLVEMDRENAIAELNKRIEATKNAVEKLSEEFQKISEKMKETSGKLRDIKKSEKTSKRADENIQEDYI